MRDHHVSPDGLLKEFAKLNESENETEARNSFCRFHREKVAEALAGPDNEGLLTALRGNQRLPRSPRLSALRKICKDYLTVLIKVDAKIKEFEADELVIEKLEADPVMYRSSLFL